MVPMIRAVYENGVFRPLVPVKLPENCEVEFEPRPVNPRDPSSALDEVSAVLSERYVSGETDVAAGHDEHQP